jgi:hypothetical protein
MTPKKYNINGLISAIDYAKAARYSPLSSEQLVLDNYEDLLTEAREALLLLQNVTDKEIGWFESVRDLIDALDLLGDVAEHKAEALGYPAVNWALHTVSATRSVQAERENAETKQNN